MIRRLLVFLGVALAFWLLLALPVRYIWGSTTAVYSAVALAICLLPALATLAWSSWAVDRSPDQQLVAVLGGTGLRLLVVSAAALILYQRWDDLRQPEVQPSFWTWILVFYLFTLALEAGLVLAARPSAPGSR